jgi:uncharacterized protein YkwD
VILIDEQSLPTDLRAIESAVVQAINERRTEQGLRSLLYDPALTEIARSHSEDMARREFFGHRAPEGWKVAERADAHGETYRMIGENLYRCRGIEDPVTSAVAGWMRSRGHRENILTPDYVETGVGVAIDGEDRFYFTQVFRTP